MIWPERKTDRHEAQGGTRFFADAIKVGGTQPKTDYSPLCPSTLDTGASDRSLHKGFRMDKSSDEDYIPSEPKGRNMEELRDTPMNLGGNKTTELTGMGDSKYAVTKKLSATPEVAKRKGNRFDKKNKLESIEKYPSKKHNFCYHQSFLMVTS